jgi:hypothetical protein
VSLTRLNEGIGQRLVKLTPGLLGIRGHRLLKFWPKNTEIDKRELRQRRPRPPKPPPRPPPRPPAPRYPDADRYRAALPTPAARRFQADPGQGIGGEQLVSVRVSERDCFKIPVDGFWTACLGADMHVNLGWSGPDFKGGQGGWHRTPDADFLRRRG